MRRLASVLLLVWSCHAAGQLYRWTDESGRTHFTDTPPPPAARDVQKKRSRLATTVPQEPYALQQARKLYPVKLYTARACDICGEARDLLNARAVPFAEIGVADKEQVEELRTISGGEAVPVLLVGAKRVVGFDATAYHEALDRAGYQKRQR
jgi:glutaredoxin